MSEPRKSYVVNLPGKATHYRPNNKNLSACGVPNPEYTSYDPRYVDCKSCRRTKKFKVAMGGEGSKVICQHCKEVCTTELRMDYMGGMFFCSERCKKARLNTLADKMEHKIKQMQEHMRRCMNEAAEKRKGGVKNGDL